MDWPGSSYAVVSCVQSNSDTFPIGALVVVTGEDFFATCAGNMGLVVGHLVSNMGDWHIVLIDGCKIMARPDQITLMEHSEQ